jgi:hypothetical protein
MATLMHHEICVGQLSGYQLLLSANLAMFLTFTFALGVAYDGEFLKSMRFMKRGVSGGVPPLVGVRPTARTGATSYKSGQLSAIGFRHLSVEQRRTLPATDNEGRP